MDKLIGRDLKDLGSVINSLLDGGKSEKAKKKKAAKAAAAAAAEPTSTPAPEEAHHRGKAPRPRPSLPRRNHPSLALPHESDCWCGRWHPSRCSQDRRSADDGSGQSRNFLQPGRRDYRRAGSRPFRRKRGFGYRSAQSRRGISRVRGGEFRGHRSDRAQPCPNETGRPGASTGCLFLPAFHPGARNIPNHFCRSALRENESRRRIYRLCCWKNRGSQSSWSPRNLCARKAPDGEHAADAASGAFCAPEPTAPPKFCFCNAPAFPTRRQYPE